MRFSPVKRPNKPEFSQHAARRALTLRAMPVKTPPVLTPARTRQDRHTQGIALVVVLLAAMILMVSMLAITSTMVISSQRTTADQRTTLQAQYAAEAGISYARLRFAEAQALFPLIKFERTVGRASIKAAIDDYCGGTAPSRMPTLPLGQESAPYCTGNPNNVAGRNFAVFANYITDLSSAGQDLPYVSSYPTTDLTKRQAYWRDMFAGNVDRASVATAAPAGTSASYRVRYGFVPGRVDLIAAGYRIFFSPVAVESTGTISAGGRVVATKRLRAEVSVPLYSIDVSRDAFSKYNYFANRRKLPSTMGGRSLVFADNETFEGRVHINGKDPNNGAPYFSASSSQGGARFNGGFTTAATQLYWNSGSATVAENTLFPGGYKFGTDVVDLPENANSQRRAALGGDPDDSSTPTNAEIAATFGATLSNGALPQGVYYRKGTSNSTWAGGIYIQGDVADLRLSTATSNGVSRQVITVKQYTDAPTNSRFVTTTFTQTNDSTWTMRSVVSNPSSTTTQTINSGMFNGMIFVNGNIGNGGSQLDAATTPATAEGLGGDGTDAADIAPNSQVTVAASGDINIKRNLTYTDIPDASKTEEQLEAITNVLGVYSEGGNVKVDGPKDNDIKIHATIMAVGKNRDPNATTDGNGFGTIDYTRDRKEGVNVSPKIELLGGVIEEQSQGVGQTGRKTVTREVEKCGWVWGRYRCWTETISEEVSTKGGYNRAFSWDKRYEKGVAPPYFPTQLKYTYSCQEGDPATTAGEPVACARNTAATWIVQGN